MWLKSPIARMIPSRDQPMARPLPRTIVFFHSPYQRVAAKKVIAAFGTGIRKVAGLRQRDGLDVVTSGIGPAAPTATQLGNGRNLHPEPTYGTGTIGTDQTLGTRYTPSRLLRCARNDLVCDCHCEEQSDEA